MAALPDDYKIIVHFWGKHMGHAAIEIDGGDKKIDGEDTKIYTSFWPGEPFGFGGIGVLKSVQGTFADS